MSDCSSPDIREAYEDVRNDKSDTNWCLITYLEGSNNKVWKLVGKGSGGLDELKASITDDFLGFGYLRVISGDEMSKRPKFVFIKYITKTLKLTLKALMNVHRGDVEKVFSQQSISIDADSLADLNDQEIISKVEKAGGAHYG